MLGKVPLSIQSCCASAARCCDRLPVAVINQVAGREDPGEYLIVVQNGAGALINLYISGGVEINLPSKEL